MILLSKFIDTTKIRERVMIGSEMQVLPSVIWKSFEYNELRMLLHETGTYVVPTEELIDYLDELLGDASCIEIGSGNGFIGRPLDMTMTDSYQQQDDPLTVSYYRMMNQPLIHYPKDVEKLEANDAVDKYRPHTVLGCYVTHRFREDRESGNYLGVDFRQLFRKVHRLILVGNTLTHADNPLMELPHREEWFPWLLTRAARFLDDPDDGFPTEKEAIYDALQYARRLVEREIQETIRRGDQDFDDDFEPRKITASKVTPTMTNLRLFLAEIDSQISIFDPRQLTLF